MSKFVLREAHFHIADRERFVLTGWFEGKEKGAGAFEAFLDCKRLELQVLCFSDDSVKQKYAKYDMEVEKEYVIIVRLLPQLARYRRLFVRLKDGTVVYERRTAKLRSLQYQLNCRITDIQPAGASCVVGGWAASEQPIKINVLDKSGVPIKCEVSHYPRPDVALEHREAKVLSDSGFSVTVPVNGRKKMTLQITDGVYSTARVFRAVDKNRIMLYLKKAQYFMKRNGMKKTCKRAVNELYELAGDTGNYMKWRTKNMPSAKELAQQRQEHSAFCPVFYLATVYGGGAHFIETAASVKHQTYRYWKWAVVCTQAEKETARRQLKAACLEEKDLEKRVRFIIIEDSQQKMAQAVRETTAWMQARKLDGAWMAFLASGDTLEPDALYSCVKLFERHKDADFCYTDEDQVSEDGKSYSNPVFKSDFNIDMLRATNYFGHMLLLRADLAGRLAGWDPGYGEDASYDYCLRAAEQAGCMIHLQRAVYHQRETSGRRSSTAAGVRAVNAHYKRQGIPAVAEPSSVPGIYRTRYQWAGQPMVSVVIPNKDHIDDLDTCVQSVLKKCRYPNYEIIIIENNSTQESTFAYYKDVQQQDSRVRVIYWKEEYNYSKINNFGVSEAKGEYILLLNNDTEVISPDFMEEMLGYCMRGDVGVCGARLFYFDDTIQHAGVVIGLGGICGEGFQRFPKENGGYQDRIFCPQDYSAVTAACLMTKKSVFEQVGGLDAKLQVAYNDIDYCLKVRRIGKLVVYNPFAMLHHYEYKSRGTENTAQKLARYNREVELFTSRWADIISAGDPYYNPNLTRRYQDFSLRRIELLK